MCTLSVVRGSHAPDQPLLAVVMNRDEQRSRRPSIPPELRSFHHTPALMPIDAESGGTWIAVNHHDLIFALLNANPGFSTYTSNAPTQGHRSRGHIIPTLASSPDLHAAAENAAALDARSFAPFSLVILDRDLTLLIQSSGSSINITPTTHTHRAEVWSSSGLGDHRVIGPRSDLFQTTVAAAPNTHAALAAQTEFHRHSWPHAPELSVAMSRGDARTVSRTRIELHPSRAVLRTHLLDDLLREQHPGVELSLDLAQDLSSTRPEHARDPHPPLAARA